MKENTTVSDIKKTILLEASIQKVWDTVSTAEGISAWFMPNDFQPVEGHEFHIQSPFGPSPCRVLQVDPPNRLSFSWDTDGWVVVFELEERDGKTEFTLTHSGWKPADEIIGKAGEKSSIIRDRMDQGWQAIVSERLKKAVEG
ncbi:SRPBCC family protein [Peribacillus deserti]|uniref:SRPBCC domain-containing protein n=1 Tax=Peribacillus deserti TaxID=673318 RepID=A0A2N5M8B6_9BACI|nr:SRPBCC domain-containing protein [Peribacillus deserti]PLT30599.1 SRPBCC domain-containing protein [Peribacillus deserti]